MSHPSGPFLNPVAQYIRQIGRCEQSTGAVSAHSHLWQPSASVLKPFSQYVSHIGRSEQSRDRGLSTASWH
jgi:hypothetical protein